MRSAPQKHPMPKTARSRPSGNGGSSGVPSTQWRSGTRMRSGRPGRASSGAIIEVLSRKKSMPPPYPRAPRGGIRRARRLALRGGLMAVLFAAVALLLDRLVPDARERLAHADPAWLAAAAALEALALAGYAANFHAVFSAPPNVLRVRASAR